MSKTVKSELRKCNYCGRRVHMDEGDLEHGKFYCNDCLEEFGTIGYYEEQQEMYAM